MAWISDGNSPPDYDSGIVSVPLSLTALPGTPGGVWVIGVSFTNTTGTSTTGTVRTVTLTNTVGDHVVSNVEVYPGAQPVDIEWPFKPISGLKWIASGTGVNGQVWGYTQ